MKEDLKELIKEVKLESSGLKELEKTTMATKEDVKEILKILETKN